MGIRDSVDAPSPTTPHLPASKTLSAQASSSSRRPHLLPHGTLSESLLEDLTSQLHTYTNAAHDLDYLKSSLTSEILLTFKDPAEGHPLRKAFLDLPKVTPPPPSPPLESNPSAPLPLVSSTQRGSQGGKVSVPSTQHRPDPHHHPTTPTTTAMPPSAA